MTSNPSNNLRKRRKDLSQYLFHFCKGTNSAINLRKILNDCQLISDSGFICFTEAPLTSNIELLNYMNEFPVPMYSKFGIGFDRDFLIEKFSARPLIYGSMEEKKLIDPKLHWRFQELNARYDFSWLREWRIAGNQFNFSSMSRDDIIVIAPSEFLTELTTEEYTIEYEYVNDHTGSSCTYDKDIPFRTWKGLNWKSISGFNSDNEILEEAKKQEIMADL